MGSSHTYGSGVGDGETFENLVEDRLNADLGLADGRGFEILNFGVGGYGPYGRYLAMERKALPFKPDAVLFVSVNDHTWMVRDVAHILTKPYEIPDTDLIRLVAGAGVSVDTRRSAAERKLERYDLAMLKWLYGRVAGRCREVDVKPFALILPKPENDTGWRRGLKQRMQLAKDAGLTVIDITDAYDAVDDMETLWIRPWDKHPNPQGHRLLADRLYERLTPHLPPGATQPPEQRPR